MDESDELEKKGLVEDWTVLVEGFLLLPVCLAGCFLNIVSIFYFCLLKQQRTFHRLLVILAFIDSIHLLSSAATFSLPQLSETYGAQYWPHIVPFSLPLAQTTVTASAHLTVSITLERYFAVVHPLSHFHRRWVNSAAWLSAPGILFSIIFSLPNYFMLHTVVQNETETAPIDFNETFNLSTAMSGQLQEKSVGQLTSVEILANGTWVRHTTTTFLDIGWAKFRDDPHFIQVYVMWLPLLLNTALPLALLLSLNSFIYARLATLRSRMRRTQEGTLRRRERRMARISLLIVLIFVICHTLKTVPSIFELFGKDPREVAGCSVLTLVTHLLLATNSSVNFLVYYLGSGREVRRLFMLPCTKNLPTLSTQESEVGDLSSCRTSLRSFGSLRSVRSSAIRRTGTWRRCPTVEEEGVRTIAKTDKCQQPLN